MKMRRLVFVVLLVIALVALTGQTPVDPDENPPITMFNCLDSIVIPFSVLLVCLRKQHR